MSVTRPVVKTGTLKKTKIKPAWVLASPWKVANYKGGTFTWAQAMGFWCYLTFIQAKASQSKSFFFSALVCDLLPRRLFDGFC